MQAQTLIRWSYSLSGYSGKSGCGLPPFAKVRDRGRSGRGANWLSPVERIITRHVPLLLTHAPHPFLLTHAPHPFLPTPSHTYCRFTLQILIHPTQTSLFTNNPPPHTSHPHTLSLFDPHTSTSLLTHYTPPPHLSPCTPSLPVSSGDGDKVKDRSRVRLFPFWPCPFSFF